jgi:ureidoacrylate peracid hydrolase
MAEYAIPDDLISRAADVRGKPHPWDEIAARRAAFVVIDMQNYFVAPDSQGGAAAAPAIVPAINRLARAMRDAGGRVIWVQTTTTGTWDSWSVRHETQTLERARIRMEAMERGAEGFELWPELEALPNDARVVKTPYSAFLPGTCDLVPLLRRHGIDFVLIGGTYTNVCCQASAQDAMMLNFRSIMVADCNAGSSPESHAAALNNFYEFFGDVLTVDQVVARLKPGSASVAA